MPGSHPEIEHTYDVTEESRLPRLQQLPGVERTESVDQDLEATYFDSEGLELLAAGVTLRRRSGGHDQGWHLKLPTRDPEERLELHRPLSQSRKSPPKALREAVHLLVRGGTLTPVAQIHTRRTLHRLLDATGQVVALVADDAVTAPAPLPGDTGLLSAWRQWEVELVSGPPDLLDAAGRLLLDAGAAPAATPSKLARVLGDRAPLRETPHAEPHAESTVAELVLGRLRAQLAEVRRCDPLVRSDVPDAVHGMRVAIRRLRSALATYRPFLDRSVTDPLREELKQVTAALGEVRDCEVTHQRLRALLAAEPAELLLGRVAGRIDTELGRDHRDARAHALEAMRSERYLALMDDLHQLLEDPPWTGAATEPAAAVLGHRMRHEFKRLRDRVEALDSRDLTHPPGLGADSSGAAERDARLHEVRKAAKRARYAAESLVPVHGRKARRFVRATKRVQSALGEHQDTAVTRSRLRRLGVSAHLDGDNGFSFGRLHGLEQSRAETRRHDFARAWRTASRKKLRRWFT